MLIPLYAEGAAVRFVSELGAELRDLRRSIVSAVAGQRFLGYLDGQRERMLGLGASRMWRTGPSWWRHWESRGLLGLVGRGAL